MRINKPFAGFAGALLSVAALLAQAAGKAEVTWLEPQQFSDAGTGSLDRDRNLKALADHIGTLGRRLPDGQALKITVTDLRLAGTPSRNLAYDYRVLRGGADWPTMQLRYELVADGRVLKRGDSRLSNMNYLFTRREDTLGYEKVMIDGWFKQTFLNPP